MAGPAPRGGTPPRQVDLADLALDRMLDRGGQGEVWTVTNRPDQVFKRYLTPSINQPALDWLVHFPDQLPPAEQQLLAAAAAWPTEKVLDSGRAIGFLMRKAPPPFVGRIKGGHEQLRELQYLLYERSPLWGDIEPPSVAGRLRLVRRFVEFLDLLHRREMVLGDISMRNVLWCDGDHPAIFVLDCDSARFSHSAPVLPQPSTPDWRDPHAGPGESDLDSDRYKAALLAVRVLAADAYATPGSDYRLLPGLETTVVDEVTKTFERAAGPRGNRPSLAEWLHALNGRSRIPLTPPVPRSSTPSLPVADPDPRGSRTLIPMRTLPRPL